MAFKWFCVIFIFTIISFKWAFADEAKYLSLSKGLEEKLVAIKGKELTYGLLKAIHDDYRHLVIEYKSTPQQEDYKVRFRTIMIAFYGEIVRIDTSKIKPDETDRTYSKNPICVNFWKDEAIKDFYNKLTDPSQSSKPRQLTKPEIDVPWKHYLALKIELNKFFILDKSTEDEFKNKVDERLSFFTLLHDETTSKSDKMSMAIFFINIYQEIYIFSDRGWSTNVQLKNEFEELLDHYFGQKVHQKERYLLLQSELDEVLIRLWTNKDKSNEKNSKFQIDVREARYLYLALLDELFKMGQAPEVDYEPILEKYTLLSYYEVELIHLDNTKIFLKDSAILSFFNKLLEKHQDIVAMRPKEYFRINCPDILKKINQWTEADIPPLGLKYDIRNLYIVLFLHLYGDITVDDVPRDIFEKYHIKNALTKRKNNMEFMAFEKFIRVMGPMKPKETQIPKKNNFRNKGLLLRGTSSLRQAQSVNAN